jgi:hypothetical protein
MFYPRSEGAELIYEEFVKNYFQNKNNPKNFYA